MPTNAFAVSGIALVMMAAAAPSLIRREATTKTIALHASSAKPAKTPNSAPKTVAEIGNRMCEHCGQMFKWRNRGEQEHGYGFSWSVCDEDSPWPQDEVMLDTSRRRTQADGSKQCFTPSWRQKDDSIALQKKSVDPAFHALFCNCMHSMLEGTLMNGTRSPNVAQLHDGDGCKTEECIKNVLCLCGGTCCSFKKLLGCVDPATDLVVTCPEDDTMLVQDGEDDEDDEDDEEMAAQDGEVDEDDEDKEDTPLQSLTERHAKLSINTSEGEEIGLDESLDDKCVA